jgi:sterol desaturase/sphingolipid hydroxylase (fatty acid hydroxylase superfamily)
MIVPAIVLAVAVVMIAVELAAPGRRWPAVAGWWTRAIALNAVQAGIAFLAGTTWDGWMERHRLFSAEALGTAGGAITGYLVITFVYYWWHRARHESDLLWRWLHQLHHSPRRIEIVTSFYKHPLEILVNGVLSSAIVYLVVGLDRAAATQAVMLTGLAELFYHWNVRTPHWLGYVIQRPESHCVHHEEGLHSFNFADLPVWDMAFGTFRNPRRWEATCGLGAEGEARLLDLLRGVDVIRTPAR